MVSFCYIFPSTKRPNLFNENLLSSTICRNYLLLISLMSGIFFVELKTLWLYCAPSGMCALSSITVHFCCCIESLVKYFCTMHSRLMTLHWLWRQNLLWICTTVNTTTIPGYLSRFSRVFPGSAGFPRSVKAGLEYFRFSPCERLMKWHHFVAYL